MTGPTPCRSWSEREAQAGVPHAAVVLALLAALFGMAALAGLHDECMDRAAGDAAAVQACRDMR